MNTEYKSELENPPMKRRLLVVDNVPAIEDLLDSESQRLERLQRLKEDGKLNFGDKVSVEELRALFPKICTEVNGFLGIQEGGVPNFGYYNLMRPGLMTTPVLLTYTSSGFLVACALTSLFTDQNPDTSHLFYAGVGVGAGAIQFVHAAFLHSMAKSSMYNPLFKRVTLERAARTDLIPTAGHEYSHYVQHREGLKGKKCSIFKEGHARGVQKHLAKDYQEQEDNEAFLYDVLDCTVGEFKSAYLWMCKELGQEPRKSLLKTKTSRDGDESLKRLVKREPTPHAIGNALFSIYEAQKGRDIYNHMIHGDFQFA